MKTITTSPQQCKKNNVAQWILACILTFVLLSIVAFVLIRNNFKARIDFIILDGNDVGLSTKLNADVYYPDWAKNDKGQGMVIEFPVKEKWESKDITIRVVNNGKVKMCFRSADVKIGWDAIPFAVNYRNLQINGENISITSDYSNGSGLFCRDITVEDKNAISILVEVSRNLPIDINILRILMKDNAGILISLVIVSLFVFKKLIHYCSRLGYTKCSWLDVLFLLIFFSMSYLPISHISDADKFEREGRILSDKPHFVVNGWLNYDYGQNFEKWFNDRFFGREYIVNEYEKMKYNLLSTYYRTPNGYISPEECVNKKTKWLGNCEKEWRMFTDWELEKAKDSVSKLLDFANKNNIKVYFLIAPTQGSVYGKKLYPWFRNDNEVERVYQMKNYLEEKLKIHIVYPYDEILKKSQNELMFFKTDIHWTDGAAFMAYKSLMPYIKEDFGDIKINSENDFNYVYSNKVKVFQVAGFHNGRDYNIIGLDDDRFFDVKYKYFIHKDMLGVKTRDRSEDYYYIRNLYYDKGKYNLTLFGDSFVENLEPIFPYSFKNTLKIFTWAPLDYMFADNMNIKKFKGKILDNETDVIIICFNDIGRLMYLYED